MTFSEKLQRLRKTKQLSQEELADKLEVSRQAISKWEVGEVPNLENLIKISRFLWLHAGLSGERGDGGRGGAGSRR